ncbi:MAG: hypothetical protein ACPGVB_17000, partial [Chitinophagales bacterium]
TTNGDISTSIEGFDSSIFEAKLFPTIFKNNAFLQLQLKENADVGLEVFDLQGKSVRVLLKKTAISRGIY